MVHGSLFSGIGGFDLAAEWAGWQNAFHCEWNEFGQKILKYYWPNAESYGDITKTDFTIWRNRIDVLTGGFPCQPYSVAGKRKGKEDDRHLWPEMFRAIREISPRYIVGENVYGLVNWDGGLVFNEVQTDLENEGYEVQPVILPACAVGAPHRRERIWFVAYATGKLQQGNEPRKCGDKRRENVQQEYWPTNPEQPGTMGKNGITTNTTGDRREWERQGIEIEKGLQQRPESAGKLAGRPEGLCSNENATNTECEGLQIPEQGKQPKQLFDAERDYTQNDVTHTGCSERQNGLHGKEQGRETTEFGDSYTKYGRFSKFPITEPTICRGNDGLPSQLDGITFSKWRNESLKAYGNSVVPQLVYEIFKVINQLNQLDYANDI
jgi:DNA (cytosine-5)-methyltransferase 1